ncbi:MAG: efflux RND transporter permease subunit [Leptospiraceae bacterium]|nr:efflux RND transporter permease subunit [Leptospiraceae bacterium]
MFDKYLDLIKTRPKYLFSIYFILFVFSFIYFLNIDFNLTNYRVRPGLNISTTYPGIDSYKIEEIITDKIEESISTIGGIKEIRSYSEYGKSSIQVEFEQDSNIKVKSMQVREKIDLASAFFPKESHKPIVSIFDPDQIPVLVVSFSSSQYDINEIRNAVEKTVKPEIEGIDGVTQAVVGGGNVQEILIACDPQLLQAYELSLRDIVNTINNYNVNSSLGKLSKNNSELKVNSINRNSNLHEISRMPIFSLGLNKIVFLNQISSISFSDRDDEIGSRINAENRVSLFIYKSYSANSISISEKIQNVLNKNRLINIENEIIQDEGLTIIELKKSIYFLIFCLMIFFLYYIIKSKRTFLFFLSIGGSFLYSFIIISALSSIINTSFNESLIIILLLSYLFSFKEIINNSFELKEINNGKYRFELILFNSGKYNSIIAYCILLIVFSIFIPFEAFSFFRIISILFLLSIFINLFLLFYLYNIIQNFIGHDSLHFGKVNIARILFYFHNKIRKQIFKAILASNSKLLSNKYLIPVSIIFLLIFSIYTLINYDSKNSSSISSPEIIGFLEYPSGTSYDYTNTSSLEIEKKILTFPGVKTIISRIDPGHTLYIISLEDGLIPSKDFQTKLKSHIGPTKDGYLFFFNREDKNLDEVTFDIIGSDIEVIENHVFKIVEDFKYREGISEAVLRFKPSREEMIFFLDTEKFNWSNFNFSDFADQLRIAIQGSVASKVIYEGREMDVRVRYGDKFRSDLNSLRDFQIKNSNNKFASIIDISQSKIHKVPIKIYHKNKQRTFSFTIRFTQLYSGGMEAIIDELLKLKIGEGYRIEINSSMTDLKNDHNIPIILFILNTIILTLTLALIEKDIFQMMNRFTLLIIAFIIPFIFLRYVPSLGNINFLLIYIFFFSIFLLKTFNSLNSSIFRFSAGLIPLIILLLFLGNGVVVYYSIVLLLFFGSLTSYWLRLNYVSWNKKYSIASINEDISQIIARISLKKSTPKL